MQNGKAKLVVLAFLVVLTASVFSPSTSALATPRTSGIYLTAADYKDGRLAFEGDCGSKTHKLALHDVLNKSYIDVTVNRRSVVIPRVIFLASAAATGVTIASARTLNIRFLNPGNCTSTPARYQ